MSCIYCHLLKFWFIPIYKLVFRLLVFGVAIIYLIIKIIHSKKILGVRFEFMSITTSNSNPIIIIDDDVDDVELFQEGFKELGIENEILVFTDGHKFYDYISTTDKKSFFILCDINMNRMTGFELKQKIFDNEEIRLKCIPFLMLSTSSAPTSVLEAYSLNVQGYFIKPNSVSKIKDMFDIVVKYWSISQRPASQK